MSDDLRMPEGREWLLRNGRNVILDRLAKGEPVMSLGVRAARTVDIVKTARATGHQLIWVDLEHSTMSIDTAAQICSAALDAQLVPFVRVPEREYGVIGRLLDGGAVGIKVPRVETPEQAAEIARYADGVVVGSALVERIAAQPDRAGRLEAAAEFVAALKAPLRGTLKAPPRPRR